MTEMLVLTNLAATWFMAGLIWFVQLVHYPQFAGVGAECFVPYHRRHERWTTVVVVTPMLIEAITATWLVVMQPHDASLWIGVALVLVIWISTAFLQVPRHRELGRGFDATSCRRLCGTNWVRTIAWSARGVLMLMVVSARLHTTTQ